MENLIYLDNGATSFPKPDEVYTFMDSFYRNFGVNPGRSGYDLCMETGDLVDKTRKLITDFINGNDPNRLCFSYNSTDALNLIIFGILKQGDHAITSTLEHNSVLRPLHHQNKFNGVEVDYIEIVDWETLQSVAEIRGETLVGIAVRVGDTRLIDNILLTPRR